ncbi:Spore coat protein CotF [Lentibacillus halodurans]|uniref:Spore coat protein CotF n=1 Tax=Lentibacillus halodurans TaxID=237679 RepID=A0A1I0Y209_9BACI|nr:spore coat protein [Lentibacillus halodurans]SFB06233.1 Spore coat protein CotF [Lentibacillus halodurans]
MQNQQQNFTDTTQLPPQQHYGGHDMFDAHEALSALTGAMDQCVLYEQYIQDPELQTMSQKHRAFCSQLYNTIIDTFQSGQDPAVDTKSYKMDQSNDVTYGMQPPSQPKTPMQSVNELNDQSISGFMMGSLKSAASTFTMAASEMTNPVLRRVLADSVPNLLEMAYEVFLYQNKNQYYQVPQLKQQDMQAFQQSYAPAQGTMPH